MHAVNQISLYGTDYYYTYDDNGNMNSGPDFTDPLQIASRVMEFNSDNMPIRIEHAIGEDVLSTGIIYDGDSVRAKKTVYEVIQLRKKIKVREWSTTYYVGKHFEVADGNAVRYIFAGNLRIAKVADSATHYFHKDHLGSSVAMTDENGTAVETSEYMPFGHERDHTGTDVTDYKFTDQELDTESGLYNYDARMYDPVVGRFISPDTIVPNLFDPQSLNRYSYCLNNPLIYVDPSGHHYGSNEPGGKADFGGETVSGEPNDSSEAGPRSDEGWADFFDSSKSFEEQYSEYCSILMDKLNPIRNNDFIPTLENLNRLKKSDKLVGINIELSEHTLDVMINGATVFATASAISGAVPATITFTIIGGAAKALKSSNTPCNDAISQGIQSAVQAPPAIDPIVDKIIEESINMYIETNNLPKM